MKWIEQSSGYWLAQGKNGNFLIWKEQENWHGRYLSTDGITLEMLPIECGYQEMTTACKNNVYWEHED